MNLLQDAWIPVQQQGVMEKISLRELLCGEKEGDICLPRDDMEMACLQLIYAITQVLFVPENNDELKKYIRTPISNDEYRSAVQGKEDWFDLDHPETPFMQFRGVKSEKPTPMYKLLAGLDDGENKVFVNPQGLGDGLCSGCAAIALFNMANNCPSIMPAHFKPGLRGDTSPITVLIKGRVLRETIWLNVLTHQTLMEVMFEYDMTCSQKPSYVELIKEKQNINLETIGLTRGLFWQSCHYELFPESEISICGSCGEESAIRKGFKKEAFAFERTGYWSHPLSPKIFSVKKGNKEWKTPSFTTTSPSWIHMSKLLVAKDDTKEGQQPAPVVMQARHLVRNERLQFVVGGYRNKKAQIVGRRHEFFDISQGWADHPDLIDDLVKTGQGFKTALRSALYLFANGIKDKLKGAGVDLCDQYDRLYYQQTQIDMESAFSRINFSDPEPVFSLLEQGLQKTVEDLFSKATEPYQQEPKMLKALAIARKKLRKKIAELKSTERGGMNETVIQD